jgi:hypothetical protein
MSLHRWRLIADTVATILMIAAACAVLWNLLTPRDVTKAAAPKARQQIPLPESPVSLGDEELRVPKILTKSFPEILTTCW